MTDIQGQTPFFYAVDRGNKEIVKKLLDDTRLDPNLASEGFSPLANASARGSLELLEMLLCDERVNVNNQNLGYPSPLLCAVFRDNEENCLRLLCAPNINVNCCLGTISALMWAIVLKRTTVVAELLKKDHIDVNYQDNAGRIALMLAIEEGNDEISMGLLSRKNINLTLEDVKGERAVDYALKSGNSKTLREIRNRLAGSN
ncbi:ankyrin repeat-containing domain protein [Aspergillus welwitschiae]|uniref:Ankyrin repeat-containing domain protein n=1 Tax=Aspergillus welwitschiae TaxID=1341132 RepID=A0A3F3PI17_9EURO|nr:ankyrin repeat-containing domain protein [Aspergillus welwitschiae]RDH26605.1 ankyrin repeat-containing domain protein [Aspergillus welwitschiae]